MVTTFPTQLSGVQMKAFADALMAAFPVRSGLARMVRFGLGKNLDEVVSQGSLQEVVFELTRWAESQGSLEALLRAALQENPRNPALRGFAQSMGVLDGDVSNQLQKVPATLSAPLQVFVSYAHEDEELKDRLMLFLKPMQRDGLIGIWHDRDVVTGTDREAVINDHLERADVVLLLVSQAFLASTDCYDRQMVRALERNNAGHARVVPIILRPCAWANAPFAGLQVLPRDAKPITQWVDRDAALLDVEEGLRGLIVSLRG